KEHDKEVARKTRHKIADFIKYAGEERIGNAVRYIDFEHELTEADIKRGQEIAEVIRTNSDGLG
ncbi:MAG TPA: hypothetical protein VHK27_15310, partial [Gammaproteobacteria bacterium]|nr:hypothetical protein [Gammaproteobacteria bacterium]